MDKVRIGVIGLGNMGSAHARNLFEGKIGGALLSAVCDIDPARLEWAKKELGSISFFDDYKKLIESNECDAVVIATPHYFHAPIAIDALNSGLNVMSEKPESVSVSDAKRMNEAARESGKVFGIMFNQRTNPLFIRAREEVKSGRLGELIRATWIITNWYRTQYYYNTGGWRASWKGEGGGVLLNQAPHNLDILQWIIGMPDSLIAVCDEGSFHDIEVEDNATVLMKYKNGARAQFITTTGEYPGTNRLEIVGTLGKIVIEEGRMKIYRCSEDTDAFTKRAGASDSIKVASIEEVIPENGGRAHVGVLEAFAMKILGKGELVARGEEGINQLTLTNAAYLSSWTGKEVSLPLDGELYDKLLCEKKEGSSLKESKGSLADGKMSDRWSVKW